MQSKIIYPYSKNSNAHFKLQYSPARVFSLLFPISFQILSCKLPIYFYEKKKISSLFTTLSPTNFVLRVSR